MKKSVYKHGESVYNNSVNSWGYKRYADDAERYGTFVGKEWVRKNQSKRVAYKNAKSGDIVTLSPASASFDKFPNFVVRGNYFKEQVNKL